MPKTKSPTARALELYRSLGFAVDKVEQRLPHCFITRDLFNCLDLVAMKEGVGIVGVQVTSGDNHAARKTKICAEPLMRVWLACGGRIELVSFAKRCSDGRGSRKTYQARREEIVVDDLTSDVNGAATVAA